MQAKQRHREIIVHYLGNISIELFEDRNRRHYEEEEEEEEAVVLADEEEEEEKNMRRSAIFLPLYCTERNHRRCIPLNGMHSQHENLWAL